MQGQTYEYQYEADIKTSIPGSTEHSSLHLQARAQIDIISTCEMVLRLSDVVLQDSEPTRFDTRQQVDNVRPFKQSLENNPLRFAFIDGTIENICPASNEEVWALNIKRGIISTLQNTMGSLQGISETTETDVSGICPVKYEVSSSFGTLKLKKTKNLLGCTDRTSAQTVFQSVGYDAESKIQSLPLMKGTHECSQEINGRSKVMSKVECTELHVFRPFSREGSGATTEIKYKMTFQRQMEGTQRNYGTSRSRVSLLFDHTLSSTEMTASLRDAQDSMTKLCRQTETDVRPEAPALFSSLVKQMRRLDGRALRQLLAASKIACGKGESFYRDALPVLGSTASVGMIRELVTSGQVQGKRADVLITSLAFIKNPTQDMMKELQSLLSADMERSALPISSVVNTYCKLNKAESPEVAAIIKTFENELRSNCRTDKDGDVTRILLALRSIGNAGNAAHVVPTLNRCATNQNAPMVVRIAAVSAYRRMSCEASREEMFRIYENKQLDSELRINAYLTVMQCLDSKVIDRVRTALRSEEINQVGSFVWTHLTNLAESSCPLKAQISEIISDPALLKEFDVDKRKFSRNIELSTFNELLNVGAAVDSNLIWSAESYVPRSATFNLTVDMFGESVNLLEVGGRAQGLEEILERYFGPGKEFEKAMKRDKRAVIPNDFISNIDRRYTKTRDPTQLSYFLRVFGNEIRSGDLYNINMDSIKNKFNVQDLLTLLAQDRTVDFTRSYAFLDSNLVIPTGVGMPLKVGVEGTVTVALKANGKIDVRRMLASPSNFDITGSVRPSAALEVQGEFGVDAQVTRTRLRITNTMHTSTVVDGKMALKNGQVFNVDWNMPMQKIEVFSAESHFYVSYRGQDREQIAKGPKAVQLKRCTDPSWANKVGFEVCGELAYPAGSIIPMSGPSLVKIYINKIDTFTAARFEVSIIRNQNDQTDTARLSFTTPGSRVDRELTADFKLDRPKKDVSLTLKSPWKKIAMTGQIVDQPALKRTTLKAVVDDKMEYSLTAELTISEQKAMEIKYTPNIKVIIPGREPITLDGDLTYIKGKKLSGNVAIRNALSEPITAEGAIEFQDKRKSQKYDANVQFSSPVLRGSVSGFVTRIQDNGNAWASRADINYQYMNGNKQRIVINHKLRDSSAGNLKTYSTDGSWTTTMWPRYNGNFAVEEQYSQTSVRTRIEAGFDTMRKIVIVQSGAFDVSAADKKLNEMLKLEVPYKNWNYEAKLDHIHNANLIQSNGSLKYEENREHTLDLGVRREPTKYLAAVAEGRLKMAGRAPMTMKNTITEKAPREYHNELTMDSGMGKTVRAMTVYKMGARHEMNTDVQATGFEPLSIKGHVNPNLKNMQARVEVKYGRREYMGDVNWIHRGTAAGFNTRAGAEVTYLNNNYGLSAELSRRNQDFSATVEAKMAEGRKVTLTSTVTASQTSPKVDMRIEWPRNFVAASAGIKYQDPAGTQGWAQTPNDLEAFTKITTSFRGFEEMGGLVRFDVTQDSIKSSGEVTWAPDRKIVVDVFGDKSRASINVTTPFNGYRNVKGDVTYQLRGRTGLNTNAKLQWENNQITITGTATTQRGRGYSLTSTGELTLTTPWRGYRTGKLTWSHQNDDGTTWKCHHELEMEGGKKYVMDIDGTNNKVPGRTHQVTVKATFTSPIQGWEQVALNWDTTHDYRMIKSQGKGSLSWGRNTIQLDHDVNIQPYNIFVVKAKLSTPYRGYEVMGIDLDNKLNTRSNSYTLTNELSLGDPKSKVNLDGTLSFNGPTFNSGIRITTPHPKFPRATFNLRNARQTDGSWALHGDMEYAPDRSFTLDTKLTMDRTYGLEMSASSPFEYLRSASAKALANVRSPKSFDVTVEVSHNMLRDKIKSETVVDVEQFFTGRARVSTSLQTPFRQLSSAKLALEHVFQSKEKCLTTASYELNEYRGQFRHEQNVRDSSNFDGKTRIEYLTGRTITFDHRLTVDRSRAAVTASLVTPFNEARSVDVNLNLEGPADNFKASAEVTLNRRDKISVNLDHMMNVDSGTFKSSLRIVTPYSALQKFVLSLDHTGSAINNLGSNWNAVTETNMEYNDKRWYAKREIEVENGAIRFNSKLETPYETARKAELKFNHTPKSGRSGRGWSNTWSYENSGKRYTGESEYIEVGNQQMRAKVVANVPDEYSIIVNHKTDRNEIATGISVKAGPHATGTASFKMDPNGGGLELRATVETPYKGYEKFDMNLKHEGPVSDFKTTANLSTPFRNYRNFAAVLTYRGNPSDFTSSLQIDTPFRSLPKFGVSANHKFDDRNSLEVDSGASLVYGDKRIAATLTYKTDGNTARATGSITTPYEGYESMTFEANHAHTGRPTSWRAFRTSAKVTTSRNDLRQLAITLDVNAENSNDVRVSADVTLPAGVVSTKYTHTSRAGELRCNLEVTTPYRGYEKFTASVEHQNQGGSSPRTKITVTTPIRGYESFILATEKSGTLQNLSLKAELTTSMRQAARSSVTWTHSIASDNIDVKGLVETSYPGYEKMGASLAWSQTNRGMRSAAAIDTSIRGYERFAYSVDYSMMRRNSKTSMIKVSASLETPYQGYDKFGGNMEFSSGQGEGFRASADVTTPIQGYKNFGASINHAGVPSQFETSGRITTPFRAARQIDYTIKHRGSSISDFATGISADYSGKKIAFDTSFKLSYPNREEMHYEGSLKMTSPCPYFTDLTVTAAHNRKPSLKTGSLAVTLNSQKKVDLDYSYTTGGDQSIVINVRDPYPLATNFNLGDNAGSATVNWDANDESKKVRFDFGLKNVVNPTMTERLISFKTMIPRGRTVGFAWGYTLTQDKFTNRGELLWDNDPRPDFAYEIEAVKSLRRSIQSYDGKIKVSSSLLNADTTFSHKTQPGRKYTTELGLNNLDRNEKFALKSDLAFNGEVDFTHSLTAQHPRYFRDVSLVTETKNGNSFTTTLTFDRQTATLEGQLVDQSQRGDSVRYAGKLRLTHPNSLTDVQIGGDLYMDNDKMGGNVQGQYQTTRDRQMKTASLRAEINRIKRELSAEFTTPLDSFKLSTLNRDVNNQPGVCRYDVIATVGGANYKTTVDFSARDRSLDIKLFTNKDDYIQLFAQAYSPTQSSFELARVSRGQKITDVKASTSISDERILTGYAILRPGLTQEIKGYFTQLSRDSTLARSIQTSLDKYTRAVQDELDMKKRYLSEALAPLRTACSAIAADFNAKIEEIQSAFSAAYRRNDFYMRDIHQALKRHYDDLSRRIQYKNIEMQRYWQDVKERMRRSNQVVADKWNEISDSLERQTRPIREEFNERMRMTKQFVEKTNEDIREQCRQILENLRRQPWFQKLAAMQPSDFFIPPAQLLESLRMKYEQLMYRVQAAVEQATNRPEFIQYREAMLRWLQENQWVFQYLNMDQRAVQEFMYKARAITFQAVKAQAQQSVYELMQWNRNRWTIWDPRKGEFAFEVYMPVDLPDLSLIQRLDMTGYIGNVYDVIARYLPDDDWTLLDTIYAYKPKSDVRDWVPPFKAHASLSGSQHFMTFDKNFFEFAGECSYLLARDFIGKTFCHCQLR